MQPSSLSPASAPAADVLAIHVMRRLTIAQREERLLSLDDLARELEVRRRDVRAVVSILHRQGYVDALRMRLTLAGFAIGASVLGAELTPVRRATAAPPSFTRAA